MGGNGGCGGDIGDSWWHMVTLGDTVTPQHELYIRAFQKLIDFPPVSVTFVSPHVTPGSCCHPWGLCHPVLLSPLGPAVTPVASVTLFCCHFVLVSPLCLHVIPGSFVTLSWCHLSLGVTLS